MIVSFKDIYKMIGMLLVSLCAVLISAMFLNYYIDLATIENLITADISRILYEA